MKFSDFQLRTEKLDSEGDPPDGVITFSFTMSGVRNVSKIQSLWSDGAAIIESYLRKEVNVLSLVSLVGTVYGWVKKSK